MSESATEARIRDLSRQLNNEKRAHTITRNELQQEIARVWRLVPRHYISLMGVYPPLRKLLHVLAEAADLQDPARGAATEDVMRVDFVHTGENASSSHPELAAETHLKHRENVRSLGHDLNELRKEILRVVEFRSHRMAQRLEIEEWEYDPPSTTCAECGSFILQPSTGRPRKYCLNCSPAKTIGKHQRP